MTLVHECLVLFCPRRCSASRAQPPPAPPPASRSPSPSPLAGATAVPASRTPSPSPPPARCRRPRLREPPPPPPPPTEPPPASALWSLQWRLQQLVYPKRRCGRLRNGSGSSGFGPRRRNRIATSAPTPLSSSYEAEAWDLFDSESAPPPFSPTGQAQSFIVEW